MKKILIIAGSLLFFGGIFFFIRNQPRDLNTVRGWAILLDYDPSRHSESLGRRKKYDMIILDPDTHPVFDSFAGAPVRIAYVSVGEAESYRSYWDRIKGEPWVLEENQNWDENYYVDVRSGEWQRVVIDTVIPEIVEKGFEGIFMDTLDTASYLEHVHAEIYEGSKKAMTDFVRKIRRSYPELILVSNNGFSILEDIGPYINGVLAEDIFMMPDFERGGYMPVPPEERAYKVEVLKRVQEERGLPVFVIDYAAEDDRRRREYAIRENRRLGFCPYIAEKELDRIYRQETH